MPLDRNNYDARCFSRLRRFAYSSGDSVGSSSVGDGVSAVLPVCNSNNIVYTAIFRCATSLLCFLHTRSFPPSTTYVHFVSCVVMLSITSVTSLGTSLYTGYVRMKQWRKRIISFKTLQFIIAALWLLRFLCSCYQVVYLSWYLPRT